MKNSFVPIVLAAVLTASCSPPSPPKPAQTVPGRAASADGSEFKDQLFRSRAFEVALWAMPATDSFGTREAIIRDLGGKPNDVVINTRPMDSDVHLVALQTQTPYLQGAIDLRNGPVVMQVPQASEESHLYGVISDAWQRPLEDIDVGLLGWDKGKGAKYLLLPPGYDGKIPAGYKSMRSRTFLLNFLIRSISTAGWDAAVEYGQTLEVYPLAQAGNPSPTTFLDMSANVYRAAPAFDASYFDLINMVIQEEPANEYDKNMLGMASYIGIEKGKPFEPNAETRAVFEEVARAAQDYIMGMSDGVSWVPAEGQSGWTRFNLFPGDIAEGRLYVYEDDDNPIDSSKDYRIRMPGDFPARDFWSVFGYDSRTRTFIANGTKGRHLSSKDDLVKNDDGSTDIYIGPTRPKGLESNWIETIPGSEIFIGLRTYGPEENVLKGDYKIPRFELVK